MHVHELFIFPLKSCAGIKVQEALVTKYGLALPSNPQIYDRRWMIVKEGRHQSQRVLPSMALIQPVVAKDGLTLRAPKMPDLFISTNAFPKEVMECQCWNDKILGLRYDDSVSQWLRTYFGTEDEFDLVAFDDGKFQGRQTKNGDVPNVARDGDMAVYHDMSALHLCSLESVADLNTRLEKKIEVYNFRPNIIVTDISKPFEEDLWREIEINGVKLTWLSPCTRCLLPTVDQKTGIKDPTQESWKVLRSYRRKPEPYGVSALFGIYLAPTDESSRVCGTIRVNDFIQVTKDDPDFWNTK
ncbi:unnamed protein product [Adineta ricciae]|uniref:MOSC domain-containing protein n=1 Tax=Adineta ricciae TaxID=249248 RepID=A0A814R0E4_ADIRI|nr:unnamed protein product [Adineta ricciae]CAF1126236.1 unnamed protein product [Adineta ricciae]